MGKETDLIKDVWEAYPFPLVVVNAEKRVVYVNPEFYSFFMPDTKINGVKLKSLIPADKVLDAVERVLQQGGGVFSIEECIIIRNVRHDLMVDVFAVEHRGERLAAVQIRDVSQKKLVDAKQEKEKIIAACEEVVKRVFTQVQPVAMGILNVCNLLEDIAGASRELSFLKGEATRLVGFVDQALDLVSPVGDFRKEVNLYKIIEDALVMLKMEILSKNITVVKDYLPGIPDISGDPLELFKAFMHIIKNAVEASENQGIITISVAVESSKKIDPSAKSLLKVEVASQGEPIPDEVRDRMFLPFVTTKQNHLGLGLSKAFAVVREHGGDIEYMRKGDKNVFSVYLPL